MKNLKQHFHKLAAAYSSDESLIEKCWLEIENCYGQKGRHYHNISHLENLYGQLFSFRTLIQNWNVVLFSLYYHDIVYNASKRNNEEKSADLAVKRMTSLGVPADEIEKCKQQILATKSHQPGSDFDTDLFTDADLSILGMESETYRQYCKDVRSEYSIYPDFLYNPGRKKVLLHFLGMDQIYKTNVFFEKFELPARKNIENEILSL